MLRGECATRAPAWLIDECVQAHHAGLMVMASYGRSGLGRFLLDSIAQTGLRECAAHVLLVRLNEKQA